MISVGSWIPWRWRVRSIPVRRITWMRCAVATALITHTVNCTGHYLTPKILADVYLLLTGGQKALMLGGDNDTDEGGSQIQRLDPGQFQLTVLSASDDELAEHQAFLDKLESKGGCIWKNIEQGESSA